jgi:hypothetical protein
LIPPASITLNPLARASAPIIRPPRSISAGSNVAACAVPEGAASRRCRARPPIQVTPRLASVSYSAGTPSRGNAGM